MKFFGYHYDGDGYRSLAVTIEDIQELINFIKENLQAPQLIITDSSDHQILLLKDGIDLYNNLENYGISLQTIFSEVRTNLVNPEKPLIEKPEWEILYDNIGLSPGEIRMRQRVKKACQSAKTVSDVADLLQNTYFDAHFLSEDEQHWWRYFDATDYSASLVTKHANGKWIENDIRVHLSKNACVRHVKSSEDNHTFLLLDQ